MRTFTRSGVSKRARSTPAIVFIAVLNVLLAGAALLLPPAAEAQRAR